MPRRTQFVPYRPKTILNKHKRADHWFWSRYSAYPYLGCQHGCLFCYCREQKYSPYDDPEDFAHLIKVKENAALLLRRGLERLPRDVVFTGDYQPAERKFKLSRAMLEVCLELGFPVMALERSPLVLRDLDLLRAIHARARAVVAFSVIAAPDSPCAGTVRQMENLAPPGEKRFAAMAQIAAAGIPTGVCFMPVLPGVCDAPENIDAVARWTADHGGSFILAGGLTLADQQRAFFFNALQQRFPDLLPLYRELYPEGSYGLPGRQLGLRVRAACARHGLSDRMPRPVIPGEKRALNKRIVEALANRVYTLEIEGGSPSELWDFRKAAWAVEDLEQDIGLLARQLGERGLAALPGVKPAQAQEILRLVEKFVGLPENRRTNT